jgi:hypothetical protein
LDLASELLGAFRTYQSINYQFARVDSKICRSFCLSGEQTFRNVWGELWFDLSGNAPEGIKFCFRRGNQRERTRRGRNRVRLPVSGHPPHTTTACGFLTHLRCFPIRITAFIFSPTATITRVSGDSPSSRFPEPGWICHVESIFLGSSELSAARADLRQATGYRLQATGQYRQIG